MAEHQSLAEALAAFQAEVPKMSKDEHAKVTGKSKETGERYDRSYNYAGLDQFVEIVEPVLGKHGLSITSKTTFTDGLFMLEVSLLHESGERETAYWPLPDPRRVGPQDLGSAMTYGKRYLGWGLTGTFPSGVDDDGAKAQQRSDRDSWESARPRENRPVSAPPAQQAPKTSYTDDEVLRYVTPMPTADVTKALQVYDWMASKDLHKRVVQMDYDGMKVAVTATDLIAGRIADEAARDGVTLDEIKALETQANNRGLMKIEVGEQETLALSLLLARDQAAQAASDVLQEKHNEEQERLNEERGH